MRLPVLFRPITRQFAKSKASLNFPLAKSQYQSFVDAVKECSPAGTVVPVHLRSMHEPLGCLIGDCVVMLRGGSTSSYCLIVRPQGRAKEVEPIAEYLKLSFNNKPLLLSENAICNGSDLLITRNILFVGLSSRTNPQALVSQQAKEERERKRKFYCLID